MGEDGQYMPMPASASWQKSYRRRPNESHAGRSRLAIINALPMRECLLFRPELSEAILSEMPSYANNQYVTSMGQCREKYNYRTLRRHSGFRPASLVEHQPTVSSQ